MRRLLLIILFVSTYLVKGQPSCSTTGTVGDIFYPNTISTPTTPPTNATQFLCGPNTVVYDTVPIGCLFVHVNTGCTLFYNKGCPQTIMGFVWLKNNSTLNILPNCPGLTVYYEPLAIINNPTGVVINSVACTSVIFPAVNCATGINESVINTGNFKIYPNPNSGSFKLKLDVEIEDLKIIIYNSLGQSIHTQPIRYGLNEIQTINISKGLYHYTLSGKSGILKAGSLAVE